MTEKTFSRMFYDTDLLLIIDTKGKVMYYMGESDSYNVLKGEDVIGKSIFELYPYFKREDFTVFKAIDQNKEILSEYQNFTVDGKSMSTMNSAFPLANEFGVIGGMVISIELPEKKKKRNKLKANFSFNDIITKNKNFIDLLEQLKLVAQNDSNILIVGETGTGKELIAHAIHNASNRSNKPFLIQNCAALPSSIIESILFGTAKGSYTGAIDKPGIFEAAEGGTICLDEINSLPLDIQSKLLRVLENGTIRRIGENEERDINVRVIASCNERLEEKVAVGTFRADLLYRLDVFQFQVPPLRERKEDIKLIIDAYILQLNLRMNKLVKGVSEEVLEFYNKCLWNGNIRELKNAIEYSMNLIYSGYITMDLIPEKIKIENSDQKEGSMKVLRINQTERKSFKEITSNRKDGYRMNCDKGLKATMEDIEKQLIVKVLKENKYNINQSAKVLQIPLQTLYYKIKKYEI